ncbi:MAG: hypothetical protein IPH24_12675 [Crocinitomicaceae bacterium]|nr:hypothetical protein [Crocinitomicaceae bacterium]
MKLHLKSIILSIIFISSILTNANSQLTGYWKLMNSKLAPEFCGYKILEFKTDSTYSFLNRQSTNSNVVEYTIDWKEKKINLPTSRVEETSVTSFIVHNPDSITFSVHADEFVMTKISELDAKNYSQLFKESQLLIELPISQKIHFSKGTRQYYLKIKRTVSILCLNRQFG